MQPGDQGVGPFQLGGLTGQHQENGLEDVFGCLDIAQDTLRDVKNHCTMPVHQSHERCKYPGGVSTLLKSSYNSRAGRARSSLAWCLVFFRHYIYHGDI